MSRLTNSPIKFEHHLRKDISILGCLSVFLIPPVIISRGTAVTDFEYDVYLFMQ
jgi:hypothetical protein